MRVLVTGGAGFIGSHLVDALVERGDSVLVVDDLSTGKESNLEGAVGGELRLERLDVADGSALGSAVSSFDPELAFHLAAQADVRRAVEDPAFDATVNVLGTINLLEALRAAGGPPVVFTSTGGAIYGEGAGRELPFGEQAELLPETGYGASKLAGEVYLGLDGRLHGTRGAVLRLGNVYGPRQDPHGEAGVVAIFCGKLLAGEAPRVYGDGKQTRDYVLVSDVVTALLAAGARISERPGLLGPLNVGTGLESTVLDLIDGLAAALGEGIEPVHAPERRGEIARVAIDPAAARRELGWEPAGDLTAGLKRTWEWFRERRP